MSRIVKTPLFPLYSDVRACIRAWEGETVQSVRNMINALWSLTGTPQNPVDWSDPSVWIPERLKGDDARLASKLWEGSQHGTNPRHVYGCYLLVKNAQLMDVSSGKYVADSRSRNFLSHDSELEREVDAAEGIPFILSLLTQHSSAKRSDLLEPWGDYLLAVSRYTTLSVFKDSLRRRLLNLTERSFVTREGNRYVISKSGRDYLALFDAEALPAKIVQQELDVIGALNAHNAEQRKALHEKLMSLTPYAFEHFVKELLEAMDYENVEVTKQSGDKGVDVVANFQFGITEIKEVVQVKRTESTITRPTIDQLRGALPYHGAIRGTLITLGRFAKGVEESALFPGAAPITLIDGKRLLELVEKHEVGLKRKPAYLIEVDAALFSEKTEPDQEQTD